MAMLLYYDVEGIKKKERRRVERCEMCSTAPQESMMLMMAMAKAKSSVRVLLPEVPELSGGGRRKWCTALRSRQLDVH